MKALALLLFTCLAVDLSFAQTKKPAPTPTPRPKHAPIAKPAPHAKTSPVAKPLPKPRSHEFYVRSLDLRIRREPWEPMAPYDSMNELCESRKNGRACYFLGAYHEERRDFDKAKSFYARSCRLGYAEACRRRR